MELHHDKHHRTYVTNLNNALTQYAEAEAKQDLQKMISLQSAINFNGGGEHSGRGCAAAGAARTRASRRRQRREPCDVCLVGAGQLPAAACRRAAGVRVPTRVLALGGLRANLLLGVVLSDHAPLSCCRPHQP